MALFVRPRTDRTAERRAVRGGNAMQQEDRLVAGTRQAQRLIAAGKAARVFIAADADERIRQTLQNAAQAAFVPVETCESMELLGRRCRIAVPCAVAAEEKGD